VLEKSQTFRSLFFSFYLLFRHLSACKPTMAAVAPAVTFRAALQRMGFNVATQNAINENGFDTIIDLLSVSEEDLDRLPKHLGSWRDPELDPEDQVRIPFVALKRLSQGHALLGFNPALAWC
jgi:hypothetical protein